MKKTLSFVLSFVLVLTMLPFAAFGADIESIEYERREPCVAYYETNGEWRDDNDGENQYFYYFGVVGYGTDDTLTINYSDGTSSVYVGTYVDNAFQLVNEEDDSDVISGSEISVRDTQQQTHWTLGDDNYYYFTYGSYTAAVQVSVVINPISAIAFRPANDAVYIEHANGEWRGEGDERYFEYSVPGFQEGDELDVTYRETGETVTYTYSSNGWEFYDEDGNALPDSDTELFTTHEGDNVWEVSSDNNYYYVRYRNVLSNKIYVSVIENPVSAIAFEKKTPVSYVEGTHMYHDNWDDADYYDDPEFELGDTLTVYDKSNNPTVYTFYYDEETESRWSGRFVADGKDDIDSNDVSISTDQRTTPWKLGQNNYTVEYAGFTVTLTATITENPVASIAFTKSTPVVYYEGADMYYDNWDDAYYYNTPWVEDGDVLTVYDKDGGSTVYTYGYDEEKDFSGFIAENGATISSSDVEVNSKQRETAWKLGDNACYVEYMGRTASFTVSIIQNPVTAITYTPKNSTILENSDGYTDFDADGEEYFRYWSRYVEEGDVLSVTYSETDGRGTVVYTAERDDNGWNLLFVAENGDTISSGKVNFDDNQREEHWTVGGDNHYIVEYMGATTDVAIAIVQNPVKSISFKPATAAVFTDGEQRYDEYDNRYFFDMPQIRPGDEFTVEYTDERGKVTYTAVYNNQTDRTYFEAEDGDVIEFEGNDNFERYDYQREVPWTVGGEFNYYIIAYSGRTCRVPVTVKENTVKAIMITPKNALTVFESDVTTEPDENGAVYAHYNIPEWEDGTVLTVTDTDDVSTDYTLQFDESDGERYFTSAGGDKIHLYAVRVSHTQATTPWTVGGENYFTATYLGATCQVPVTLTDTDVEWITFEKAQPIVLTEYEGGEWKFNDQGQRFYEYRAALGEAGDVLTVKYKSGETVAYTVDVDPMNDSVHLKAANGSELDVNEVDIIDGQWVNPWRGGSANNFTVKYHGVSCRVGVTVNHVYVPVVTAPTCTEGGYTTYTCEKCNEYYVDDVTQALGHKFKDVITPATLTKNGKVVKTCSRCGEADSTTTIYAPKTFTLGKKTLVCNGKYQKNSVTVKDSKGKVIPAANYSLTYKNHKSAGTAVVEITFKGKYSGSKKLTYAMVPPTTSIKKLTGDTKSFTVKWKKQNIETSGYQIQYSLSKNFSSNVNSVYVKGKANGEKKVTKLRAKKTYYVRIRTYKTVNGKKVYSGWSKATTVKTK